VITFSRNFGHQIAITAGVDFAQTDAVVIIDADLQDPPELIPGMIDKWKEGNKIVHMKRKRRSGESVPKIALAKMFYRFFNTLSVVKIPHDAGDFKLLDKDVVNYLKGLKEHNKFIRGLVMLGGFKEAGLEYDRPARFAGKPKYSLIKSSGLALNGVVSLSAKPIRVVTFLGLGGVITSILVGAYTLLAKFLFPDKVIPGWASLLLVIVFFSSIQLISLGIVGEYVGRIFDEVKNRPLYVIKERTNC
jgi:polyisoprenyl-phosphate glycosyltransferase